MNKIWQRVSEINARLNEIARSAKAEGREFSKEEKDEINALTREKSWSTVMLQAGPPSGNEEGTKRERRLGDIIREGALGGKILTVPMSRAEEGAGTTQTPSASDESKDVTIMTADAVKGSLVPLTVGEVIKPLVEGVIYDKIGLRMPTGLAGDYVWPVVGSSLVAEFVGEGVALTAQGLDLSKVKAAPQRLGVTVELTCQSIMQSRGLIESIVREQIAQTLPVALNDVILGGSKKGNLTGPFATAGCVSKTISAIGAKTYKELNKIKAFQLNKGYGSEGMVWIMTEGMKAELECTPKDAGSGLMVVENDRMCGLPVFCSHLAGDNILLGDFRYQVCGQFGTPRFVVDPVTQAKEDKVLLTLNIDVDTATLREDAFVKISVSAA